MWPEGTRLPTLEALAAQFGVARVTVRQACQMLVAEGLLRAQPGKGTFVQRSPRDMTLNAAIQRGPEQLDEFSIELESCEPVSQDRAPGIIANHGAVADSYVCVRKRHCLSGSPCVWMDIYIATDIFNQWPDGAAATDTLANLIRKTANVRISGGYELLEIGQASQRDAAKLDYGLGMPVAKVTRLYADQDERIIYAGFNVYRGDRFRYERDIVAKVAYGMAISGPQASDAART